MARSTITATLVLRLVVEGAARSHGIPKADELAKDVVKHTVGAIDVFWKRFNDNSQKMTVALQTANDKAWTALEGALAGDSWWGKITERLSSAEDAATRQQIRKFLDVVGNFDDINRKQCLRELKAARSAKKLSAKNVTQQGISRHAAELARFANPSAAVDAEWRLIEAMADDLQPSAPNLCRLLIATRHTTGDMPLIVTLARYFFRRQVETDRELFQSITVARIESVAKGQEEAFAALDEALARHGEQILSALADVQAVVIETHGVVVETHDIVQRQKEEIQRLAANTDKTNEKLDKLIIMIASKVDNLVIEATKRKDATVIRSGDSTKVDLSHRQDGLQLLKQIESLPAARRQDLVIQNTVAKVSHLVGDYTAATRGFQSVAAAATDRTEKANAHSNAYNAALEGKDWTTAVQELVKWVNFDVKRYAPFPVDKYLPVRILGAGGFGIAFLCKHKHMNARVVVKTLRTDQIGQDPETLFGEATRLKELDNPYIIRVSDCGYVDTKTKDRPYIVMDYFESNTLEEQLQERPLPLPEALTLFGMLANGFKAAHEKGIIHRDIKPANILVRQDESGWQAKIIDFGLAVRANVVQRGISSVSLSGQSKSPLGESIAGTIDYAAPEQMGRRPDDPIGPYSDIYGFAKTMCFTLFQTTQPLGSHWRSIPQPLADLLEQCLVEDPKRRPQKMADVVLALKNLQSEPPLVPKFLAPPVPRFSAPPIPLALPVETEVSTHPPANPFAEFAHQPKLPPPLPPQGTVTPTPPVTASNLVHVHVVLSGLSGVYAITKQISAMVFIDGKEITRGNLADGFTVYVDIVPGAHTIEIRTMDVTPREQRGWRIPLAREEYDICNDQKKHLVFTIPQLAIGQSKIIMVKYEMIKNTALQWNIDVT